MRLLYLFLVVIGITTTTHAISSYQQLLDGHDWNFREKTSAEWYKAKVPGVVHMDLMDNNLIPDPYYGDNWNKLQWIENNDYVYQTFFTPDQALFAYNKINLVFDGLDTHADIWLNGELIGAANNMWRTWTFDISSLILYTSNNLTIVFHSAVQHDDSLAAAMLPLRLPCENSRIYSRKAQYHYGWDWGPRLVTCGIWKSVRLESWDVARIKNSHFVIDSLSDQLATLKVTVNVEHAENDTSAYTINVQETSSQEIGVSVYAGNTSVNSYTLELSITNPKLWWVRNIGTPYLYTFEVSIAQYGKTVDTKTYRIGLRQVELIQEDDSIGRSFKVRLNGKDIYMKGANYIPSDMFLPRVTDEKYKRVIQDTVDANYNMLRVWGGGTYEKDIFYDLCDENGILLFHDFMFAGGMYPGDASFLENVEAEITEQVIRLRNHASIAFWNGNNEIQEGWDNWGWVSAGDTVYSWFKDLFQTRIPSIIAKEDPQHDYVFTSPRYGWGYPESLRSGDSHYWGVWVGQQDIEAYDDHVGRFATEYGVEAFPSFNTIKNFTNPNDWSKSSPALASHQRHSSGFSTFDNYLEKYYKPLVSASAEEWIRKYCYLTQVFQKLAIKTAIESFRRNQPRNMGTLVWQLNDVWPGISWSSVDYLGNWKALHYAQKKLYDNTLVSFYREPNSNVVKIYIVNDELHDIDGTLKAELLDYNGNLLYNTIYDVRVPERSSANVMNISTYELTAAAAYKNLETMTYLRGTFKARSSGKISQNSYYFSRPIYLELKRPSIQHKVEISEAGNGKSVITFTCNTLALDVYLFNDEVEGKFSDNFFDLHPNEKKQVYCYNLSPKELNNLKIASLYDVSY